MLTILPHLVALSSFFVVPTAQALTISSKLVAGIWKVQPQQGNEILLRLHDDGSFAQCEETSSQRNSWTGLWELRDLQLCLALDRHCSVPYMADEPDVILSGPVAQKNEALVIPQGHILAGKSMYPRNHLYFFEQPLSGEPRQVDKFVAHQVMRFSSMVVPDQPPPPPPRQFQTTDFYQQKFYLTVTPLESKLPLPPDLPVDIRTMRMEFHTNHTFTIYATNKILRGRYEVTKHDELQFSVSRFGAGKSVKGSVYSEGPGLSHEDERTYLGDITRNTAGALMVHGSVTFGTDLGSDARPEPVGNFRLWPVQDLDLEMKDDEEEKDIFDSVFE